MQPPNSIFQNIAEQIWKIHKPNRTLFKRINFKVKTPKQNKIVIEMKKKSKCIKPEKKT